VSAPTRIDLEVVLSWMAEGESFVAEQLAGVDLRAASLLPGWTGAQLASHLASNARALGNLLHWARTGEETPMYPNPEARGGRSTRAPPTPTTRSGQPWRRPPRSSARPWARCRSKPARVRSALGRDIPASEVPWLRVREVWIHAVDLGGVWFDALLSEICGALGTRERCPDVLVAPRIANALGRSASRDPTRCVRKAPLRT